MSCGCGRTETTNYAGKEVLFKGQWYTCVTQDRLAGTLGIIYEGKLTWIRPSRIEAIR